VGCEGWLVVDDVLGPSAHEARLHWLLADLPFEYDSSAGELRLRVGEDRLLARTWASCPANMSLVRGGELLCGTDPNAQVRGWISRTYAEKEPALSLAFDARAQLPLRFITYLGVEAAKIAIWELRSLVLQLSLGELLLGLAEPGGTPIFACSTLRGADESEMVTPPGSANRHLR